MISFNNLRNAGIYMQNHTPRTNAKPIDETGRSYSIFGLDLNFASVLLSNTPK